MLIVFSYAKTKSYQENSRRINIYINMLMKWSSQFVKTVSIWINQASHEVQWDVFQCYMCHLEIVGVLWEKILYNIKYTAEVVHCSGTECPEK